MGWSLAIWVFSMGHVMGVTSVEVALPTMTTSTKVQAEAFWKTYEVYLKQKPLIEAQFSDDEFTCMERLRELRHRLFGARQADDLFGLNHQLDAAAIQKINWAGGQG